jgi:predicted dehydrogenase
MVRVGIAGYGMAGKVFHAPLVAAAGLEVAAISTSNPDRRAEAHADHPGAQLVDDLDGLLELGDLDVIALATPSGSHAAHALAVIEAGIPVVVDKPLAANADDALEVVDAAERAGVPLTVFQNRRYDSEHATLAEVVQSGSLGEIYRAEFRWERWRPVPKGRWRETADPAAGGGIMLDLHTHLVDAAVQLFGEVETVYAEIASHTTTAEDDAFLACRHTSGVVSHLGVMAVSAAPGPRMRVLGSRGAFLLSDFDGEPSLFPDLADADPEHCGWIYRGEERDAMVRQESSQVAFYEQVGAALHSDDPQANMPVDPRDAVHVLAVIDAARTSASAQRVVEVITPGQPIP